MRALAVLTAAAAVATARGCGMTVHMVIANRAFNYYWETGTKSRRRPPRDARAS